MTWLAFGILTLTANAQHVYTWTGNDGINRWTKKKNWLNGALPIPGVDTWLVFTGNVDPINTNDFAEGSDFAGFIFAGTTVPFTLRGNGVALSSGISNLDAVTQTISLAGLNLAKPEVFFGAIGDLVINSPVSGSGTLVKTLSGKVILGGDNSYTGGTEIRAGTLEITSATNLGSGAITLAGGTLSVNNSAVISLANDILVTAPSTLQIAQGTTVLSGSISGDARLTLAGAGLLQVALNAEAFTGVIDVQSARVQLSATRYVPVEVHGGEADLEGDLLDVQVFNGGTVDVVDPLATGSLHTLDLKINAGGRLALELGGTNAGASIDGYDQLKVDGTITLGGSLAITQLAGFSPALGQNFFLLENDGNDPINGAFSNAPDGGIFSMGGVSFMVSYAGDSATGGTSGGNDLVLTVVPQVPESWSSSLGGVGVLLLLRRRRAAATRSVRRGLS